MAYQTIFFDLDGTLIDPKDSITKSVQYALSQFCVKAELNDLLPFIGPPLKESFPKYYGFDDEQTLRATNLYREHFAKNGIQETLPYRGIKELLQKLKEKNKNVSIVTIKMKTYAPKLIQKHNLHTYFDYVIGSKPDQSNAAKPILVKEALSLYPKLNKNSFVMIGDREHDVFGAQANGIDSIAVEYGYGSKKELRNSKPTHIVKTVEELEKLLLSD